MQLINPGLPFSFIYPSYDENEFLFVQASIYDVTTGTDVFLDTVNMVDAANGVYSGNYTGLTGQTYLVVMSCYTDGTYSTVDTSRSPAAECYQSVSGVLTFLAFNYGAYDLDPNLNIRAKVYDTTSGTPTFVVNVTMVHVLNGVYFGTYTATADHSYSIPKFVYTNSSFTFLDTNRAPGSDIFQCSTFQGGSNIYVSSEATLIGQTTDAILIGQSLDAILEATDA